MNNIFTGTYTRGGVTYDYSGIWSPLGAGISWKAIVRHADVVCRPAGMLSDGLTPEEILDIIRQLIELNIVETLEATHAAQEPEQREAG